MGRFEKGNKMSKGRPKGAENKSTEIVKRTIANAMELSESRLMQELNSLEGTEYINAYTKLAKYIVPTLQSQSIDMDVKSENIPLWIENLTEEDTKRIEEGLKNL